MDSRMIEGARLALESERERLQLELSEEVEHPRVSHGAQTAAATEVSESQRGQQLRGREEQHLVQIEAALTRIEAGTFGLCQTCGKPIAPGRLEALPWALDCIDCHAKTRR
jgi:DnaK suppressor protein